MEITVRVIDWTDKISLYINLPDRHLSGKARVKGIYRHMIGRCYGRYHCGSIYQRDNIQVCQDWLYNFENFYQWAVMNGYSDELTIDRIHNDLNYQPNNCRWVTKEQNTSYRGMFSRPEIGF